MSFKNKLGKVTRIEEDIIYIDNDPFLIDTRISKLRFTNANPKVGDEVIFNFNKKSGELIYLQVKHQLSSNILVLTESHSDSHGTFKSFRGNCVILPESRGEMVNLFYHDGYEEWSNNEW